VRNLSTESADNEGASYLALGTDSTSVSSADTSLGNEVYRTAVTDAVENGNTLTVATFFDSAEANGNDLEEVGLFTAADTGLMLNHAQITTLTKTASKTLTVDVDLTFTNP